MKVARGTVLRKILAAELTGLLNLALLVILSRTLGASDGFLKGLGYLEEDP